MSKAGIVTHTPIVVVIALVAATMGLAGCTGPFAERYGAALDAALRETPTDDACGDFPLVVLVPDCPVGSACFTSACEAHDLCYAMCGVTRAACDIEFYASMVSICLQSLPLEGPDQKACLGFASVYWSAVDRLGQSAFDETQFLGGCTSAEPEPEPVACCTGGSPAFCNNVDQTADCPFDSVLIPGLTCDEVRTTLGGCPAPPNDECLDRQRVCDQQEPDREPGYCARGAENELAARACSLAMQDCPFGETCVPYKGTAFHCEAEGDNRLATNDGPAAGGDCEVSGIDSFQADVWFEYTAPCSGIMSIDMCEGSLYDSMLAVYGSSEQSTVCSCPTDNLALRACNDDYCAGFSSPSGVTVLEVVEGACYVIRVGGWSNEGSDVDARRGMSRLNIGVLCDIMTNNETQ